MQYSLSALTTVADCDAVLDKAALEQGELNFKKTVEERQYRLVTTGSSGVDAELSGVLAEISGLETAVSTMPDGPAKQTLIDNLTDLNHKKYLLEKRRRRYGTPALLQKECDISCIEQQIAEKQTYIDAVTQRKAALPV